MLGQVVLFLHVSTGWFLGLSVNYTWWEFGNDTVRTQSTKRGLGSGGKQQQILTQGPSNESQVGFSSGSDALCWMIPVAAME